nr:MAG TPA: major capsid protein [Caudoviricetes sp.]
MAQDAKSILSNTDKDKLAVAYGYVIESIQKGSLAARFKNKDLSGDPTTGSVEANRFINSKGKDYGTARGAAKGDALNNKGKVFVQIDTDREIVEEIAQKDIKLRGIPGIIDSRKKNHAQTVISETDAKFFSVAETEGSEVVVTAEPTIQDKVEALIQAIETTKNEYVDGVDREMIKLSLTPKAYGKLRNYLDTVKIGITTDAEEIQAFHGVEVVSNVRQTKDAIAFVDGAIAQPLIVAQYDAEKLPLSNDYAAEMFYNYGTKAVTPDLIKWATVA